MLRRKTREEIKQDIETEKAKHTTPYEKDKGYDMCKDFINHNKFSKEHLFDIDIWECFQCYLYVKLREKFTLEECERIRTICEFAFEPLGNKECLEMIEIVLLITELKNEDEIMSYITVGTTDKYGQEKIRTNSRFKFFSYKRYQRYVI